MGCRCHPDGVTLQDRDASYTLSGKFATPATRIQASKPRRQTHAFGSSASGVAASEQGIHKG